MLRKKLFMVTFTSKVGMDKLFPVLPAHLEYMIALARKGVLFAAGPMKKGHSGRRGDRTSTGRQRTRHGTMRTANRSARRDCAASKSTNGSSWKAP